MTWYYKGEPYNPNVAPEEFAGFVYEITDPEGIKYIGKKQFWSTTTKKIEGRKNRKKTVKESDWRKYYGSSKLLKEQVKEFGEDKYYREILKFCETKGECSYFEAKYQFERDVLLRDDYYNELIMCRINSSHLRRLKNNG